MALFLHFSKSYTSYRSLYVVLLVPVSQVLCFQLRVRCSVSWDVSSPEYSKTYSLKPTCVSSSKAKYGRRKYVRLEKETCAFLISPLGGGKRSATGSGLLISGTDAGYASGAICLWWCREKSLKVRSSNPHSAAKIFCIGVICDMFHLKIRGIQYEKYFTSVWIRTAQKLQ